MLLSMTGFGRAEATTSKKKITVEIKSLNSKQLDLNARMPSAMREQELELRAMVGNALQRGKVDLVVSYESIADESSVEINKAVLSDYVAQIRRNATEIGIPEPADWFSVLLRLPDAFKTASVNTPTDEETQALRDATSLAIDNLMNHRRAEGEKLEAFFAQRIQNITDLLSQIHQYEVERVAKIRARIEDGLAKIPAVEYDKGRLEQEMIFYIEKLDVSEEKQRLTQHLHYFTETMNLSEPGQGKKLGFIAQEMGREINTLGSKSNHAEMQIVVVKMKDELEQIKEQVLNVM